MPFKKTVLSFLIFATTAFSQEKSPKQFHEADYKIGWDLHFSPYAGGEDLLFAHRSLERGLGLWIENKPIRFNKKAPGVAWRISELLSIWLPLNCLAVTVQHEVFGHGYRIRDIGHNKASVIGYDIGTPPPYGDGGGATNYEISDQFTTTDDTVTAMAGVESTAILAQLTKLHWLEANHVDPRQSGLYIYSLYDLPLYVGSVELYGDLEGHDINAYIRSVNRTYTSASLKAEPLKSLSWINLADPFTYYSLYAWGRYAVSGKETHIPMIPIYSYGYLPSARFGLTPFGPEIFLENYLLKGNRPTYFYLKAGNHSNNTYLGAGLYAPALWSLGKWSFGARFDAWRQPKLLLQPGRVLFTDIELESPPDTENPLYPLSEQQTIRYGAAGSLLIAYKQVKKPSFEMEVGYKAQGFLPGYPLKASPVARIYYVLNF
jgi:hypothetical protein